jgi:hypothetical protein
MGAKSHPGNQKRMNQNGETLNASENLLCRVSMFSPASGATGDISKLRTAPFPPPCWCAVKVKTADLQLPLWVYLVLALVCFTTFAQAAIQIKGKLEVEYLGPSKTNSYDLAFLSSPPNWELQLRSRIGDFQCETYGSPEQTIWVTRYDGRSVTGSLNIAEIKIFPGPRPFDLRGEEHVWVAFLSSNLFNGPTPIRDLGLCIREPSIISKTIAMPKALSPTIIEWHNERADAKLGASRIEGQFRWLSTNYVNGFAVPSQSELLVSLVDPLGNRKPITRSVLIASTAEPVNRVAGNFPAYQGRILVSDFRPVGCLETRVALNYEITNGIIPDSSKVAEQYKNKFPGQPQKRSTVFWVCLVISAVSGILLFGALRSKAHQANKQS